ncbi:hypothetical protein ELQ90_07985 [Labedella phragmitis]|uniref:Uncharacterized protein n=1 Tax=Labedella phragmitis TaxID=2498849 RepID=A0A3S3Z555_9MICO|nr:hypothetical protein [Labedella phragmitis]RWZ51998.1 hypothetical protein ELQ90_07985 [Labedella phragmitis]
MNTNPSPALEAVHLRKSFRGRIGFTGAVLDAAATEAVSAQVAIVLVVVTTGTLAVSLAVSGVPFAADVLVGDSGAAWSASESASWRSSATTSPRTSRQRKNSPDSLESEERCCWGTWTRTKNN